MEQWLSGSQKWCQHTKGIFCVSSCAPQSIVLKTMASTIACTYGQRLVPLYIQLKEKTSRIKELDALWGGAVTSAMTNASCKVNLQVFCMQFFTMVQVTLTRLKSNLRRQVVPQDERAVTKKLKCWGLKSKRLLLYAQTVHLILIHVYVFFFLSPSLYFPILFYIDTMQMQSQERFRVTVHCVLSVPERALREINAFELQRNAWKHLNFPWTMFSLFVQLYSKECKEIKI